MTVLDQRALTRWRRDAQAFISEVLIDPDSEQPFELLPAEITFLKHAFSLNSQGRLKYPELIFGAIKKSGKTAFAAMVVIYVVVVLAERNGEGFVVANDLEQAQGRVFAAIKRIVHASPLLAPAARIYASKIEFPEVGASITALASDYASAAGANPHIVCFDELWAYTSERSHRLWDEMIPPPTRKIACRLTTTYAGFSGESALLESLYQRGMKARVIGKDLRAGDGLLMFWSHKPIAPWQTKSWLAQMKRDLRPNQFLRMIQNVWTSGTEQFIDMEAWDACVDADLKPLLSDPRLPVWVGVDASYKRDSTALVACTYDRTSGKVVLVTHKVFQPTHRDPLDFEHAIERTLLDWRKRYRVRQVFYDPWQMQAVAQHLIRQRVPMKEFAQSIPNLTEASNNLYELIQAGNLRVYRDVAMRLAVSHAGAVEGTRGWKISKERTKYKIDVVIALGMAALGAVEGGIARAPMVVSESVKAWAEIPQRVRLDDGAGWMSVWSKRREPKTIATISTIDRPAGAVFRVGLGGHVSRVENADTSEDDQELT